MPEKSKNNIQAEQLLDKVDKYDISEVMNLIDKLEGVKAPKNPEVQSDNRLKEIAKKDNSSLKSKGRGFSI